METSIYSNITSNAINLQLTNRDSYPDKLFQIGRVGTVWTTLKAIFTIKCVDYVKILHK
jgi:hypothetical protein